MIDELRCKGLRKDGSKCDHLLLKNAVVVIACIKCPSCGYLNNTKLYDIENLDNDKTLAKIISRGQEPTIKRAAFLRR